MPFTRINIEFRELNIMEICIKAYYGNLFSVMRYIDRHKGRLCETGMTLKKAIFAKEKARNTFLTGQRNIPVQKPVDAKNVLELPVLKDITELLSIQLKLTYDHS